MKEQGRDKGKVYPELTLSLKDAPKKSPKGQIKNVNVPRTVSTRNMERRSSLVQSSPKQAKTLGADRSKLSPE